MATITQFAPETGRLIGEDGQIYNIVDLLGPGTPVGGGSVANVNDYTPKTGRVIGEDGQIYNLVDLFQSLQTTAQAAAQADSTAIDTAGLVTDFNALLAKLRAAGLMAT